MVIGGAGPKVEARPATSAAPVGVTSSSVLSTPTVGMPCKRYAVAGAGRGILPWSQLTKPRVFRGSGADETEVMSRSSKAMTVPSISTMESTAPTSWKCTLSSVRLWTLPSAWARSVTTRWALSL